MNSATAELNLLGSETQTSEQKLITGFKIFNLDQMGLSFEPDPIDPEKLQASNSSIEVNQTRKAFSIKALKYRGGSGHCNFTFSVRGFP